MRRLAAIAALALVAACGPDLGDVPLPSKVSGPTYPIDLELASALNLPEAAPVKIDGTVVGEVESIRAVDYTAHVRLRIAEDVVLPAGTTAQVRLTAPVGEAFVALTLTGDAATPLASGDSIPLARTDTAPDTTDLLTGVSSAVTGGSYADVKTVVDELVTAMDGSSDSVRRLLRDVDAIVTSANDNRDTIDASLDRLDTLAARLAEDGDVISTGLTRLDPALDVLQQHEDRAIELLNALDRVEGASTTVLDGLRGDLAAQLEDTRELVDVVVDEQDRLRPLLQGITAFADGLERATPGDYAMFDLTANLVPAPSTLPGADQLPGGPPTVPDELQQLTNQLASALNQLTSEDGLLGRLLTPIGGGGS